MRNGHPRHSGFTLIELMIVVAILMILITAFIVISGTGEAKAKQGKTDGLIAQLQTGINQYYRDHSEYPPDVMGPNEEKGIVGARCLIYYLAVPRTVHRTDAFGNDKAETFGPYLELEEKHFDIQYVRKFMKGINTTFGEWKEDLDEDIAVTKIPLIMDGWGKPIYYDRILGDKFDHQGKVDPRSKTADTTGRNPGSYDLWSLGQDGLTGSPATSRDDMKNW